MDATVLSGGASALSSPGTPTPPAHMDCLIYPGFKPGCKVRDSSHRIINLNILIVSPDHDAGPSSQFQLNFSKQTVFHVLNVHFRIIAQADGYH